MFPWRVVEIPRRIYGTLKIRKISLTYTVLLVDFRQLAKPTGAPFWGLRIVHTCTAKKPENGSADVLRRSCGSSVSEMGVGELEIVF